MQRHHPAPAILVTFAELAWIIVFLLVFIHITQGSEPQHQQGTSEDQGARQMAKARDLERQLAQAIAERRDTQKHLVQATTEQHTLQQRLAEVSERLHQVGQARDTFQRHLTQMQHQRGTSEDQVAKARDLERQLAQATTERRDTQKHLVQATTEQHTLQQRLAEVSERLHQVEQERDIFQRHQSDLVRSEGHIRKDILGLQGPLKRVVILFDTSGSMSSRSSGQGRWELARNVVATWLEQLPFEEVALILFNDTIRVFPDDGTLLNVQGAEGHVGRRQILDRLNRVAPAGDTNTLAALARAYQYPNIDTLILFTDGKPEVKGVPNIKDKIYQLCRKHRQLPVNTVGLGNYFEGQFAEFLLKVAYETGGTFLGR